MAEVVSEDGSNGSPASDDDSRLVTVLSKVHCCVTNLFESS